MVDVVDKLALPRELKKEVPDHGDPRCDDAVALPGVPLHALRQPRLLDLDERKRGEHPTPNDPQVECDAESPFLRVPARREDVVDELKGCLERSIQRKVHARERSRDDELAEEKVGTIVVLVPGPHRHPDHEEPCSRQRRTIARLDIQMVTRGEK